MKRYGETRRYIVKAGVGGLGFRVGLCKTGVAVIAHLEFS